MTIKRVQPVISVITVCFNSAPTIARCLDSVRSQRGVDIEHVVIDGGSTDGTLEIIENAMAISDNMVLLSEPDSGIYDAMNKGLKLATGRYIAILNSDDFYRDEHTLGKIRSIFQINSELDAVLTDIQFVDSKGVLKRKVKSKWFTPSRLSFGWMPPHPGMVLSSKVYERYGVFRTDMKIAADYEYCVRIFGKGGVTYLHSPITSVHMLEGGASTRGWQSNWTITLEIIKACQLNQFPVNVFLLVMRLPLKFIMSLVERSRL